MESSFDPRRDLIEAIDAGGSRQADGRLRVHRALRGLTESRMTRMPAALSRKNLLAWLLMGLVRFPGAARTTSTRASYWQAAAAEHTRARRPKLLASESLSKLCAEHLCHYLDFPTLGRADEEQIEWLHRIVASLDLGRLRRNQQSRLETALDELGYLDDDFDGALDALLEARGRAVNDFERFFSRALDTLEAHGARP